MGNILQPWAANMLCYTEGGWRGSNLFKLDVEYAGSRERRHWVALPKTNLF